MLKRKDFKMVNNNLREKAKKAIDDFSPTPLFGGDDSSNFLIGTKKADAMYGRGGNDTVYGEDGNDQLFGGRGSDRIMGDKPGRFGNDMIYCGPAPNEAFDNFPTNNYAYGGLGDDIIVGDRGRDLLRGGPGDDQMLAGLYAEDQMKQLNFENTHFDFGGGVYANNALYGDQGADLIAGSMKVDVLVGGTGSDTINGYSGDDLIVSYGSSGNNLEESVFNKLKVDLIKYFATDSFSESDRDVLTGGRGNDTFMVVRQPGVSNSTVINDLQWNERINIVCPKTNKNHRETFTVRQEHIGRAPGASGANVLDTVISPVGSTARSVVILDNTMIKNTNSPILNFISLTESEPVSPIA